MTKKEKFHEFCEAQIERLGGAFPEVRYMKPGALQELAAWLESRADGNGVRAAQFISSVTEFGSLPTMAELSRLWSQMFAPPAKPIAAPGCEYCAGTGWEEREFILRNGIFAGEKVTAASRCRCGGMPPDSKPEESYKPSIPVVGGKDQQ